MKAVVQPFRVASSAAILLLAAAGPIAREPTADTYLRVRAPEQLAWSPDGKRLAAYLGNAHDGEIRVYDVATRAMTRVVTDLPRPRRYKDREEIRWSADGRDLIYRHGTGYFTVPAAGGAPRPLLPDTLPREIVVLSPAGDQVSFVRNGDLWVQRLPGGSARKISKGQKFLASQAEFYGRFIQWTQWSPDGKSLVYLAQSADSGLRLAVVRVADGRVRWLPTSGAIWDYYSVDWGPGGRSLAVSRLARDFQRKELLLYDVEQNRVRPIWEDTDPEWVNHNIDPSFGPSWSPDGTRIAFISNRGGWRQLRVVRLDTKAVRTLTEPGVEVWTVWWSPDGRNLLVASGQGDRHSVRLWAIPADGGTGRLLSPVAGTLENAAARGMSPDAVWSPDGSRVAYGFTRPDEPFEIAVADAGGEEPPAVLYSATAESLPLEQQAREEPVTFTARDGTEIPAVLMRPRAGDGAERHPALVYHYGGWGQQARLGWTLGIKSRLFQYLVSRGWVVLLVDPRGSEGYGRTYSHGLYHQGGGLQADDLADAAAYLRRQSFVRPDAIALFGHSYGAYLALTTMLRAPDAFQAGVLQSGVYDFGAFATENTYVKIRFGDSPKHPAVPDLQLRPVRYVDRLKAPLLVYHGTNDFNAPNFFSEQLVRALMKADREFEYMAYPNEPHDWDREETERDFLQRTERFLARHLDLGARPAPAAVRATGPSSDLAALVAEYSARIRAAQTAVPDLSFEKVRRGADSARVWLQRLDRIDESGLSHQETLTRELLRWEAWKALQDTTLYWYQFDGLPAISPFRSIMARLAANPLAGAADRDRYVRLVDQSAGVLVAMKDKMAAQLARGIVLPREQVDNVLGYLRSFAAAGAASPFVPSAARMGAVPEADRAAFADRISGIVEQKIEPAARALAAYVDRDIRRAAPDAVGLWQYPGGKEAYRILVRRETTLETSPEEIHALAVKAMADLEARMQRVRDSLGFKGTKAQFHERLRHDPRFYVSVPDSVGARLLAYAQRLEPVLDREFSRRPRAPYGTRRLDRTLEPSMTYGYYSWPVGSDPKGYYFFNGSDLDQRSLLMAGAIAFHELIPGHHLQINLQRENDSLPAFRRTVLHAGFTEGWGEYASSVVAAELGMYRDAYEVYGRLVFDAFFIARLVVDTGMNYYGWPRSRAVAYMKEHTLESDVQIDSETLRYSTRQPAQALAYRMGRETFVRLRQKAQAALGDRFDIRRFHDALLMSGTMPLFLLERHIDWWIAEELRRVAAGD